jgi:3-hydroxyisobutyrate dehydrogenase
VQTIGFIGLGMMGDPMAARLVAAGRALVVRDAAAATTARFVAVHPDVIAAPDDAAFAACDAIVTMLPNSDVVDAVVLALLPSLRPRTMIVDMSSSDPVRTRALAEKVRTAGLAFVDAPVSGGVTRARAGTLAIMAGGEAADVAAAGPLLALLGNTVTHVGAVGAGHAVKALNNYVSAAGLIATADALLAAQRFGLDPALVVDVLNSSTGRNNSTENKAKQFMLSGTFASGFSLALMAKDVAIAVALGESLGDAPGAAMGLGAPVRDFCRAASAALGPDADHTAVYRYLSEAR